MSRKSIDARYSEQETERRRDEAIPPRAQHAPQADERIHRQDGACEEARAESSQKDRSKSAISWRSLERPRSLLSLPLSTSSLIGQPLALRAPNCSGSARGVVNAKGKAVAVPKVKIL